MYSSLQAALGATRDARGPVTIRLKPGVYRETVHVWPSRSKITLTSSTGNASDVVITYDLPVNGNKFYGGTYGVPGSATFTLHGTGVTVGALTIENAYDESVTPSPAVAVRAAGGRTVFDGTRLLGDQGTVRVDSGRTYLRDCYIEGDVDIAPGRGTAVLDDCTVHSTEPGAV
jgi:pectinesterase